MSLPSPLLSARDRRLDEVIHFLAGKADHRSVIRLVETWSLSGNPTRRARYHQARSFFALRLMDRAMARAREVAENHPDDADALQLLAEIYLERGWPSNARKILAQLKDKHPSPTMEELWKRAHAEPTRMAAQAREIEGSGDPSALLTLVEYFLTTGSFFRARSILERLRRMEPDNRRVQDLLWGLDGAFSNRETPIEKLLEELGGGSLAPPMPKVPENTESARKEGGEEGPANFPSLFKTAPVAAQREGSGEHTSISHIATLAQMAEGSEDTDPGRDAAPVPAPGRAEDTQIMLVLRPTDGNRNKPLHKKKEEDPLRETLNLRDWQASMGMTPAEPEVRPLEEEDENVVLLNKNPPPSEPPPEPSASLKRPIEVIEKHPTPIEPALRDEPFSEEASAEADPHSEETTAGTVQTPDLSTVTKVVAALLVLMAIALTAVLALVFYVQSLGR